MSGEGRFILLKGWLSERKYIERTIMLSDREKNPENFLKQEMRKFNESWPDRFKSITHEEI